MLQIHPTTVFDRRTEVLGENSYPDIARLLLEEATEYRTSAGDSRALVHYY